jgi:HK97 family phage major capsid protein
MSEENIVKEAISDMGKAFEEFKSTNDKRLEEIEKRGSANSETEEKLAKIEADLDRYEGVNQQLTKQAQAQDAVKDQVDRIETMLKRPEMGLSTQSIDEKAQIFEKYLRKGKESLDEVELKALTVSNDTTGGYLAPPEYVQELLKTVTEISPIRSIARIRSTGQRSVQMPKRTGQFSAQWVAETGTRSETTGYAVGMEEIPTHEHYALVDISEQDLEDTVFDLEAEMSGEFAEQFAKAEGTAFVSGNAVGRPEGLLTNGSVGETVSGSASAVAADGLISLVHAIKSDYARNGTFVFNRTTLASIRKLKDTAGQYVFQAGMMLTSGVPNSILGYPYVEATDMPDEGSNTYPVLFGDFARGYMIVDRVNLAVLRDPFTQATSGNVRYVARRRVGGQVIQAEAIRKLKCST